MSTDEKPRAQVIDLSARRVTTPPTPAPTATPSTAPKTGLMSICDGVVTVVVEFDREDLEFTHGWECGRLYANLALLPNSTVHTATMHRTNWEMCQRIAKATGTMLEYAEVDADWISCRFTK